MGKIVLFLLLLFAILTSYIYSVIKNLATLSNTVKPSSPIILWWTPFTGIKENLKLCAKGSCLFTENRQHFLERTVSAVIFYGSDWKIEDLPLPRHEEIWCLLHEESPKNNFIFNHELSLILFNYTSTFKHDSHFPLTLQYLQNNDRLVSNFFYKSTAEKNKLIKTKGLAPIIYLQSDCDAPSERDNFVKDLSKYIDIDSYGSCLNNQHLNETLKGIEAMNHKDIYNLISRYKFTLALENYACADYITEKLWRPLEVGSVPIYWGSTTVNEWLPNPDSIIDVRKYRNTIELATYLKTILKDDNLYEIHLEHKTKQKLSNQKLINELMNRNWGINEDQLVKDTFVESFECFLCDQLYEEKKPNHVLNYVGNNLGCPPPETIVDQTSTAWEEQWYRSKVEAQVLEHFVNSKKKFTMEQFYSDVVNVLQDKGHFKQFPTLREL